MSGRDLILIGVLSFAISAVLSFALTVVLLTAVS